MKIEKEESKHWFYYYYDTKTGNQIYHGLYNSYYDYGIGYHYHDNFKGFWLRKVKYL